jgi:hypothetical protein
MTGVIVTTSVASGSGSTLRAQSGQWFVTGLMERGATNEATLVRSMSDVNTYFGERQPYSALFDHLQTYFNEGGEQAHIVRVVGPGATSGTANLNDGAGTPVPTLKVDAANPGSWSSRLKVNIAAGSAVGTFRMQVLLDDVVVQDFNGLHNPSEVVSKFRNSPYVIVTDLGSATVAPNNNPAVTAVPVALTAGTDDRGNVDEGDYVDALAKFPKELGSGAVSIPGHTGTTIFDGIIAHCMASGQRIGIFAGAKTDSISTLLSTAAGYDSEWAGLFAPWIQVTDGGNGLREIGPEGYAAACRARAHSQVGPWKVPAGSVSRANTVLGLVSVLTQAESDQLNDGKVSPIRIINGTVRIYGWRSLSSDVDNYMFLKDRDLLNHLVYQAGLILEEYVFETIDSKGHLTSRVKADLVGLADPIAQAGGFYPLVDAEGNEIDPGYKVDTGTGVNTPTSLAENKVKAVLAVRTSPTADTIILNIVKVGILQGL